MSLLRRISAALDRLWNGRLGRGTYHARNVLDVYERYRVDGPCLYLSNAMRTRRCPVARIAGIRRPDPGPWRNLMLRLDDCYELRFTDVRPPVIVADPADRLPSIIRCEDTKA